MPLTMILQPTGGVCDPEPNGMLSQLAPRAIEVVNGQIKIRPHAMKLNRHYLAEIDGKPYVYRRISEHEIEVYGLAERASR